MTSKSLWGEIGLVEQIRTPTTILREQADALFEMTKGILNGIVTFSSDTRGKFTIVLSIVAPAINNYQVEVAQAHHTISLYPVEVIAAWDKYEKEPVKCKDENEFTTELGRILRSESTTTIVASLLAQSKAM
jgi:hypothetical protein